MFNTGVTACDQLKELSFQGNIIPQNWYKTFVKKDLKHPKPHLLAINILADIVYWYRPREERDEATGTIIGYTKRFNSDLLQRSYEQLSKMFGCSKGQATDAIVFLESMGVVKRVFRKKNVGGVIFNNLLYLALNVERLKELTYPEENKISPQVSDNSITAVKESNHRYPENPREDKAKIQDTNTEITTKTTPEITPSVHPPFANQCLTIATTESDGLSDEELMEEIKCDLYPNNQIPYSYNSDKRKMEVAIKVVTSWYSVAERDDFFSSDFEKFTYELLVDCLVDMASESEIRTYKGSSVSYAKVLDKINQCCKADGSLYNFVFETIDDYIKASKDTEIRDKCKYMKSIIWNSFSTYKVKSESYFNRTYYGS